MKHTAADGRAHTRPARGSVPGMGANALEPPLPPQLAKAADELPVGVGWSYEQKLDGFRVIAFVDGDDVYLQSRNGKPLNRYFPEVTMPPGRYVLDGELVVAGADGREQFETLQQRIHPAESRIARLAAETPAELRSFDLLAWDGESLLDRPFAERRRILEQHFEPVKRTERVEDAEGWMQDGEGVIAKRLDAPYRPGERKGMVKVKRVRTADCVVVAFRFGKEEGVVGSLILGLYDDAGELHVVGHTSGFKAKDKRELIDLLEPYRTHERGSGEPSRWKSDEELVWEGLRPELVCEINFDHTTGRRIRHGAKFVRWRDDKAPSECHVSQLVA
jgi:ATP-dependent DNA ligase